LGGCRNPFGEGKSYQEPIPPIVRASTTPEATPPTVSSSPEAIPSPTSLENLKKEGGEKIDISCEDLLGISCEDFQNFMKQFQAGEQIRILKAEGIEFVVESSTDNGSSWQDIRQRVDMPFIPNFSKGLAGRGNVGLVNKFSGRVGIDIAGNKYTTPNSITKGKKFTGFVNGNLQ
jgi:hypothetical protein